jgi:hypothetical protein
MSLDYHGVLRITASTNVRQQEIVTIRNRLSRLVVSWLAALDARLLLLRLNEELIDEPCSVPWVSKCFIRICEEKLREIRGIPFISKNEGAKELLLSI